MARATEGALRARVVAEARQWIGTPFKHQAALKGVGCDCAGLIRGVGRAVRVLAMTAEEWRPFATYSRGPNPRLLRRWLETFFVRTGDRQEGDIACLEWRGGLPMHLAILRLDASQPMLIQALAQHGRVVEHGLTAEWPGMIESWWRYPGVRA